MVPFSKPDPRAHAQAAPATQEKPAYVKNNFSSGGLPAQRKRRRGRGHGPGMPAEKAKDFKGTLRKLFSYMAEFKAQLVLVVLFAVGATVFNIVGPKVMSQATTELFNGLVAKVGGTGGIDFSAIARILACTLAIYCVSALCSFAQGWLMSGITQRTCYRLRQAVSQKINRMPFGYFERNSIGDTLSRITNDVDMLANGLNQGLTQLITSTTTIVGVLVMMLTINPVMTLVTVLIVPVSLVLIGVVVGVSQKHFKAQQDTLGQIDGMVEEGFTGQDVVKAFGQEDRLVQEFEATNDRLYQSAWKSQFYSGLMKPVMDFVGNAGYVAVAVLGSYFAATGIITVGDIQAFIQYVKNFTQPITQLTQVSTMLQQMAASGERIFEFLDEGEEPDQAGLELHEPLEGTVDFDHVSFGYSPDSLVIKDFSAHVEAGQTVALVGPTGAGKTTMVKLLMRFYDVTSGSIRVDGHDIRDLSRAQIRDSFGMVLQETWLYNATVRENIRYGRLDATDAEVEEAARASCAHHFIEMLPGGYDFVINEDASNVSQGQRQLLTIARAILANRRMLILDEATSSVDTRTEERIQQAMENLMAGRTSFVIAHRLSTIRNADLVLVVREGDIVEQGSHEELLAQGGFYAELYNSQFENCKDPVD